MNIDVIIILINLANHNFFCWFKKTEMYAKNIKIIIKSISFVLVSSQSGFRKLYPFIIEGMPKYVFCN